jgi:hypothetical protein
MCVSTIIGFTALPILSSASAQGVQILTMRRFALRAVIGSPSAQGVQVALVGRLTLARGEEIALPLLLNETRALLTILRGALLKSDITAPILHGQTMFVTRLTTRLGVAGLAFLIQAHTLRNFAAAVFCGLTLLPGDLAAAIVHSLTMLVPSITT